MLNLQQLNPRHFKMIDYCIEGKTNKQISELLSMSDRAVSLIIKSPNFQHELAMRRSAYTQDHDEKLAEQETSASQLLRDNATKAVQTLISGLQAGSEHIKLRSAESILDRSGHGRQTKDNTSSSVVINISNSDLILLKETLEVEDKIRTREATFIQEKKEAS